MHESSELLLARAQQGDRHALQLLIEQHQAQVYRFGLKVCRDPEDAKTDALQHLPGDRGVQIRYF